MRFDPERFAALIEEGRPVFIDFTADWCPNCKYNEKLVYETAAVQASFDEKEVVRFKADITHEGEYTDMIERLMASLGARSIPFMALFPGDRPLEPHVRWDIVKKADVLALLESLP